MKDEKKRIALCPRRRFLKTLLAAPIGCGGISILNGCAFNPFHSEVFIGKAGSYGADITKLIMAGFHELGILPEEVRYKRIMLKANIVEPHRGATHIVTNPAVVYAAAEAFLKMGAAGVVVAEGSGHCRDSYMLLEESGMDKIMGHAKIEFRDLNNDDWIREPNAGYKTRIKSFVLPATIRQVDWIVSMPKLKTHHWAGITLSMKNLFGVMPGTFYGWPKNVLHNAGINQSIIDITATVKPHFAIVDGIVGMEGDGPIMGTPKQACVILMGRNVAAVDATGARLMGINPRKVEYLADAEHHLGPIRDSLISQRGESWRALATNFQLMQYIEAHRGLRQ